MSRVESSSAPDFEHSRRSAIVRSTAAVVVTNSALNVLAAPLLFIKAKAPDVISYSTIKKAETPLEGILSFCRKHSYRQLFVLYPWLTVGNTLPMAVAFATFEYTRLGLEHRRVHDRDPFSFSAELRRFARSCAGPGEQEERKPDAQDPASASDGIHAEESSPRAVNTANELVGLDRVHTSLIGHSPLLTLPGGYELSSRFKETVAAALLATATVFLHAALISPFRAHIGETVGLGGCDMPAHHQPVGESAGYAMNKFRDVRAWWRLHVKARLLQAFMFLAAFETIQDVNPFAESRGVTAVVSTYVVAKVSGHLAGVAGYVHHVSYAAEVRRGVPNAMRWYTTADFFVRQCAIHGIRNGLTPLQFNKVFPRGAGLWSIVAWDRWRRQ